MPKRKATFLLQEKTVNEWDGHVEWRNAAQFVGLIAPRTGSIQLEGAEEHETVKYEVTINWRADLFRKQRERRLVHSDGRVFYIESVVDVDELHQEFKLTCSQRPADDDGGEE